MPFRIIEYRAIAAGVLDASEHPMQAISHNMNDIVDWAHKIKDKYDCVVKVYVVREELIKTVKPIIIKPVECRICGVFNCSKHANDKQERFPDIQ
jgi:hypothetical protein